MIKYKDTQEKKQAHLLKRIHKQKKYLTKSRNGISYKPFDKIKYKRFKEELKPELFVYKCDVPFRTEEIPPFSKTMQSKVIERFFKKETSVFGKWREDTAGSVS